MTPPLAASEVRPGDWFVVDPAETLFDYIEAGERLLARLHRLRGEKPGWGRWGHAGTATRWTSGAHTQGCQAFGRGWWPALCDCGAAAGAVLMIAEAEPGGAVERPWHWEANPHLWSTGTGLSVPAMGEAARRYTLPGPWGDHGVPYSFLDYAALTAHGLHIPAPGLRPYIASTGHMICSQDVDQAAMDCDVHLFDDGRWPGYVDPLDLGLLLEAAHR